MTLDGAGEVVHDVAGVQNRLPVAEEVAHVLLHGAGTGGAHRTVACTSWLPGVSLYMFLCTCVVLIRQQVWLSFKRNIIYLLVKATLSTSHKFWIFLRPVDSSDKAKLQDETICHFNAAFYSLPNEQ